MEAQPYVYRGDPRDYHWLGHVEDGAIAYFDGRPPDERWQPHDAEVPADAVVVDELRAQQQDEATAAADQAGQPELKQPNKAAPAADWVAYADLHGGFEAATGTPPAEATRKAIVDHYTTTDQAATVGESGPEPQNLPAGTEVTPNPAGGTPADAPQE